jgi:hypothetical protein
MPQYPHPTGSLGSHFTTEGEHLAGAGYRVASTVRVACGGDGIVAHAGVALLVGLADQFEPVLVIIGFMLWGTLGGALQPATIRDLRPVRSGVGRANLHSAYGVVALWVARWQA